MENDTKDKEFENIDIDKPVQYEPEKEPTTNASGNPESYSPRVGLEPVEPEKLHKKTSASTKFLFVLTMLMSAGVGAFAVWYIFF